MLKSLFVALLLMIATISFGQYKYMPSSVFGHVKPPVAKLKISYKVINGVLKQTATLDSSVLTQSTIRIMTVAGYAPSSQLVTGAGPAWQWLKFNVVSQQWETVFGAGILFWAAGNVAPGPTSPAFGVGPSIQIPILQSFSAPFAVGYIYDITNGKWLPVISVAFSWK